MKSIYVLCKVNNQIQSYSMNVEKMNLNTVEEIGAVIADGNNNMPVMLMNYQELEESKGLNQQFYLIKGLNAENEAILWSECFVNGGIDSIEKVKAVKDFMSDKFNVKNYEVVGWELIE